MKVLLLHPQDLFPRSASESGWDLVVDLGRAPKATYERWSRQAGCHVLSLYQFAEQIQDLSAVRQLLQLGVGSVVDSWGIDWWDALSLEILPQLQQHMLVHRLAKELGASCMLFPTRPHPLAAALQRILGARLTVRGGGFQSAIRKVRHYYEAVSQLDAVQLAQVLEDKFDGEHSIRRRFARRHSSFGNPVVLLPSAYTNVSRTALSYAELIPEHQFLLVFTRRNGKPRSMPPNVRLASLTPYSVSTNKREIALLLESWDSLRKRLVGAAEEFESAEGAGVLGRIPSLVRWGIAIRNAWSQIFESENVTACLCADDSNPLSSIPLVMAKKRGLPALACHHGALDYQMAVKTNHADVYLVKSEMEQDYLRRICCVAPEKVVVAAPASARASLRQTMAKRPAPPWLVFFTEPYACHGWHCDEVYRELLPRLFSLAQVCSLKLVFKLHPLESVKAYRRMLRRLIPEQERHIEVIAGPPTSQLWSNTRFALTVQSSTAVECAALDIPVFLCAWLRDPFSGYVPQYARFGVGRVLESPEQIAEIPRLLETHGQNFFRLGGPRRSREREQLADLLSGACPLPVASNA